MDFLLNFIASCRLSQSWNCSPLDRIIKTILMPVDLKISLIDFFGTPSIHYQASKKRAHLHPELPSCKRTFFWDTLYTNIY